MEKPSSGAITIFLFLFVAFASEALSSAADVPHLAPSSTPVSDSTTPKVYIIFLDRPKGVSPRAFDIRVLARVLGSREAARKVYLITFTMAASAFAAKLTPQQVKELQKQQVVVGVMENRTYHLDHPTNDDNKD